MSSNGILRVSFVSCLFVLLIASFCPVQLVVASLGVIYVPGDYPTIKQALNASTPGNTIIVSEGTYAEGEIWITKSNLTLIANGTVVVDGLKEARWVFYIITDNVTIKGFTVRNSRTGWREAGICLDHAQNCRIENNTAMDNGYGIFLYCSSHNTVANNTASLNNGYGIRLYASPNNTLGGNEVADNVYDGIHLGGSYDNILAGNIAMGNHFSGISITDSDGNTLIENNAADNKYTGVELVGVGGNTLRGSNMTGNRYNLFVHGDLLRNEIDSSNFVDGKRVYYLKNQHDIIVDPYTFPDIGYLAIINSTRVTVRNLTIAKNWDGVLFASVTNSTIENVNVTRNGIGIHLLSSCRNTLKGNIATANSWEGIYLQSSRQNTVSQNTATHNEEGIRLSASDRNFICNNIVMNGTTGIYVSSSDNNTIRGNTLANNLDTLYTGGIVLHGSDNSSVYENTIVNNDWGVFVAGSTGSIIYHNNFITNAQEALSGDSTSIWDNGYPSGGNYWSDYNGTDLYHGPYQNETGSDGIGDAPYLIPDLLIEDSQDRYPLMKPYGGSHDIGIVGSVSEKTIIAEGYYTNVNMNVTIVNYGTQTETFNFTSQIDTTIQNQTLTLASRNSTNFTFTFNTTGLPKGIYTFSAYATPVPCETCTTDNNYTTQIIITTPGDVDGDFDVDLYDAVKLLKIYGAKKGHPSYDPNCDIDGDGDIDLFDAVILLIHYGEKYP